MTCDAPASAQAAGSAIAALPDNWECGECGSKAWAFAVCVLRSEICSEERSTLALYGPDKSQFLDADEIVICGCCHGSHWYASNPKLTDAKRLI